jgi:hypothetical protein
VRLALAFVIALSAMALVGCGGDDDDTATPVPLQQRFVTEEDAPGSKPDPVETRQTTADFDEFIATLSDLAVDADTEEATTIFRDAGFQGAGVDARFFGETHSLEPPIPHVFSSFIELESEDGATSALDWLETDARKPCPMSCAVQRDAFDVDLDDARGIHRIATAEDIENLGTENEVPFESYWVGFTDGAFVFTVDLHGPPGSVSEEQAVDIARAYHDRVTGG